MSFLTAPPPGKFTFPPVWYSRPNVVAGMRGILAMSEIEPQAGGYAFPPDWPPVSTGMGSLGNGDLIPPLGTGRGQGVATPEAVAQAMAERQANHQKLMAMVNLEKKRIEGLLRAYQTELQASGLAQGQVLVRLRERELQLMAQSNASGALAHLKDYKRRLEAGGLSSQAAGQRVHTRRERILAQQTQPLPSRFGLTTVEQSNAATNQVEAEIAAQAGMTGPLNGMNCLGERSRQIPVSALRRGEFMSARDLEAAPERFGGLRGLGERSRRVPIRDLKRGSFMSDQAFVAASEAFTLAGLGTSTAQGTWLSPNQVARRQRESDAQLVASPESFGGLGGRDPLRQLENARRQLALSELKRGELMRASALRNAPEHFGKPGARRLRSERGLGDVAYGSMSPAAAAQLYALQQQAAAIAQNYQRPAGGQGAGPAVGPSGYGGGERVYVDPTAQLETAYVEGQIQLEPICDPVSKKCIQYVDPATVEKAIAAKIEGKSAYTTGQFNLPGFYAHPTLGPWGVDPNQAYQYWAAQQAAMQAAPYATPMPDNAVWGSPGMIVGGPAPALQAPGLMPTEPEPAGSGSERF